MGKTIVILKITPKEEQIENAIKELEGIKKGIAKDIQKVPIGFGIEIIKAAILIEEKKEGALEALQKEVSSLKSIEEAEVENMTLL
jgi:translation elongation factor EF-1beta